MAKLFVVSDIHGFFDEMKEALDKAGFDPNNEEHWIISCGDEIDRGPKPKEVISFLNNLERKVIIRGNHTLLLEDLCLRGFPDWHDKSNGTLDTVMIVGDYEMDCEFDLCCERALNKTRKLRNSMVNYFETKNYIFTHSFVPLVVDWRNSTQQEWNDAMWGNPYQMAERGYLPEKTLVFGHFHTSYPRYKYHWEHEWGPSANFDIYYGDGYIAIDGCTAYSGQVNVLVLEDDFLED